MPITHQLTPIKKNILIFIKKHKQNLIMFGLPIFFGILVVICWQIYQAGGITKAFSSPEKVAENEVKQTLKQVSNLILLPQGEMPTIATVTDISLLPKQPFFQQAQNGDKVLMYTGAQKAYLYRPSLNKLIEVAPLQVNAPE